MKLIRRLFLRSEEMQDLFTFLWKAKMWFIIPFIVLLLIFGLILFFAQSTGIAPFIYSLI